MNIRFSIGRSAGVATMAAGLLLGSGALNVASAAGHATHGTRPDTGQSLRVDPFDALHPADPGPGATERIDFAPGTDSHTASGVVPVGDVDRYVVWAGAGQTMTVDVGPDPFAALTTIFAPDGRVAGAGHTSATATLPASGDYVIEIGNIGSVTDYALAVTIPATGDPAPTDPPDEPQRIEFAPGTDSATVTGSLASGAHATYLFRASAGQEVFVEVGPAEFAARTYLWGEGEVANGGNSISATLPLTGDYVLEVGNAGAATADFTLAVRIPAGAAPSTTAACGVDPEAPAITDHLAAVPPAQQAPGVPWTYLGASNYDPCADLTYAIAEIEGGTGSSPQHVMLFRRGDFIGTATECAFGFTSVTAATGDSVTVEYRWPRPGEPNAAPSGVAGVTFSWTGNGVTRSGDLPDELLELAGCEAPSGPPPTTSPAPASPPSTAPRLPATR